MPNGKASSSTEITSLTSLAEQSASAPIVRSDCKLCLSKHRREIEDYFEQSSNITSCHRLLKSKGEDISYRTVRTHLTNHYSAIEQQELVRNFTSELVRWRTVNIDRESRIGTLMAVLERRMIDIAANIDGRGGEETLKATDVLCKLASQILSCQSELDSVRKDREAVSQFLDQLQDVIRQHIDNSKNHEVKKGLIELVGSLESKIGGLLSNGSSL
jgi:hypothetical protein